MKKCMMCNEKFARRNFCLSCGRERQVAFDKKWKENNPQKLQKYIEVARAKKKIKAKSSYEESYSISTGLVVPIGEFVEMNKTSETQRNKW